MTQNRMADKKVTLNDVEYYVQTPVAAFLFSLSKERDMYKAAAEFAQKQCEQMGNLMGKSN